MKAFLDRMVHSKTLWTGISAIAGTGALYATGEITLGIFVQTAVTALIGIFVRDGVAKNEQLKQLPEGKK